MERDKNIVFFDGDCLMCNRIIKWLAKRDTRRVLRFAPLRGAAARRLLGHLPDSADNKRALVFLRRPGDSVQGGQAALAIVGLLPQPWPSSLLRLLPPFLLEGLYRLVATNRYRLSGRAESCPLAQDRLVER